MRDWPLWRLKRSALAYWLLVDAAALALVVYVIATSPRPDPEQIGRFAAIAGTAGAVVIGSSIYSHRMGETSRNPWAAHLSYLAAGAVALPCNLLVLLLFGPALHGVLSQRPESHRWLFTLSATALSVFGARFAIGWTEPAAELPQLVVGAVALLVARAVLIALGLRLRNPSAPGGEVVGEPIDAVLGVVAVSIGGLMGSAALGDPAHALLAGPPMALLERAAQLPQWRRSAQRDAKTGLANAAHWDARARYELSKARPAQRPMAVMLLDLDHFKRVNDEVGHLAGDAALSAVALLLSTTTRRGDLVGRFGGEEFVVLLPDAEPAVARSVAQRVRQAVQELAVPTVRTDGSEHLLTGLTVSIGVATTERFGYELPDLLVAADSALLAAKGCGRNLVEMA
ncbi:diguanylate cyclase [Saccharothrix coeruleofusca]|uniref:GGDEF domain-containing protein n=1 Tax=Saccharothrix coeruleofusca TaxID=33919 RepID=A0A918AGI9_9PSEU|nr:diguanylate cyclase [Saccharothrix coeruleofusca]MBP2339907.1 diguanylate cyclase (GGDEF)-like protein [Saccharothrix coeruleofusca]GGP38720.1 GGDEF domain-containing protein [Saccharothrix coeruleofusca]